MKRNSLLEKTNAYRNFPMELPEWFFNPMTYFNLRGFGEGDWPFKATETPNMEADMFVEGDKLILNVNVPGKNKEDIKLSYDTLNNALQVKITSSYEKKEDKPSFYIRERGLSESRRTFEFPCSIDVNTITTEVENGVLKFTAKLLQEPKLDRFMDLPIG